MIRGVGNVSHSDGSSFLQRLRFLLPSETPFRQELLLYLGPSIISAVYMAIKYIHLMADSWRRIAVGGTGMPGYCHRDGHAPGKAAVV